MKMKELCQSSSITVVTTWDGGGFDEIPVGLKGTWSYKLGACASGATFY